MAASMSMDPDNMFNHPVVVVLGPEYGSKAGQKIHIRAIRYTLTGPVVFFPGTFGCDHEPTASMSRNVDDIAVETNTISVEMSTVENVASGVGVLQPTA